MFKLDGLNENYTITWRFLFIKTKFSIRSPLVRFLLPAAISVAVLKSLSIFPDEAGMQKTSLATVDNPGNRPLCSRQ